MGLDQHIVMARNKKAAEEHFAELIDAREMKEFDYSSPAILWYNRKNWDLHEKMMNKYHLDNGEIVELTTDDLEDILHFLTHSPDYFGGYASVPYLCKIIENYNVIRENGFSIFYEGDY